MAKVFPFSALPTADLVIDAVYEGGTKGNTADDVLGKLIPGAGNQGGFRAVGSRDAPRLVILYSSMDDPDWPDFIDVYTGVFTYFGDNKKPGHDLHDTSRGGNKLLQSCFAILHNAPDQRAKIPPFLVFTKGDKGRDAIFRGLAVPGVEADPADDLGIVLPFVDVNAPDQFVGKVLPHWIVQRKSPFFIQQHHSRRGIQLGDTRNIDR